MEKYDKSGASDWPDRYHIPGEPVFPAFIQPFILGGLEKLKALDAERAAWVAENLPPDYRMTYLFHDHARRVAEDMRRTALHMGLSARTADNLYWAMLPHDIGKAALPASLWDSVEKPDETVKARRRSHTALGADIVNRELADIEHPFRDLMLDIMLNHHEQMDGKGYRGVPGGQLSLPVRLACIVESYDGYAIERPHFGDRDISPEGVLNRMREEKGAAHYDMNLFESFAEMKLRT